MMLPRIEKIRRFMFFLDSILKNMNQIRGNFAAFYITITGKIGGGTKRTKIFSVGYGYLPIHSLTTELSSVCINYTHVYGEFGIQLHTNRTFTAEIDRHNKEER